VKNTNAKGIPQPISPGKSGKNGKNTENIIIALAGNPNSGKTTVFNALTGSNQYVGNWPGVTVEKKEGKLRFDTNVTLTDLPGIYSLSPYTLEEIVARKFLIESFPNVIINVVDATSLERSLYLTTQLLELGIPTVVALNMADEIEKNGDHLYISALSGELHCPVVSVSAIKNKGLDELARLAINRAKSRDKQQHVTFGNRIEMALALIQREAGLDDSTAASRFAAVKLFERDKEIKGIIPAVGAEPIIKDTEAALKDDAESIIAGARYDYIVGLVSRVFRRGNRSRVKLSERIDRVLTNKFLALPIFAAVMFAVYFLSVTSVGAVATGFMAETVVGGIAGWAQGALTAVGCADWLQGLLVNGIIEGVGAVLTFVPQMFILFLMLSFLEYCGYMARIAFILDKLLRGFGLSGKSFIPILIGTGCGVPGIMASRTIESATERKATIMTTTFIPCSAKLPIIALFAGGIFGGAWWVAPAAYFLGIFAICMSGVILKKAMTKLSEKNTPFVMELPVYRIPPISVLLKSAWERCFEFIKRAGTIILVATAAVWFLSNFGFTAEGSFAMLSADELDRSILAVAGSAIAVIFTPLGFGEWRTTVATITGIIAKENVVGTLEVLYVGDIAPHFTAASAMSFMAFNLLCAPCVAAIGAIAHEMKSIKWTVAALLYQTGFAYIISLMVYQFALAGAGIETGGFAAACAAAGLVLLALIIPVQSRNRRGNDHA
jgi:ferrous iron transport protein B